MKLTISINLSSNHQTTSGFFGFGIKQLPDMRASVWQKARLVCVQRARRPGIRPQLNLLAYRPLPRDASLTTCFNGLRVRTSPNSNAGFLPSSNPALSSSAKFLSPALHPLLALLPPAQIATFVRYSQDLQRLKFLNRTMLVFILNSPQPYSTYSTASLAYLLPRQPHFIRFSLSNV